MSYELWAVGNTGDRASPVSRVKNTGEYNITTAFQSSKPIAQSPTEATP